MRRKGEIYRLALDDSVTIIAKRTNGDTLLVERTNNVSVLPRLPSLALRCFGYVGDENESPAWLFIEDAGDEPCSLTCHGDLAAQWLGSLHGATTALNVAPSPPRADRYLEHLRAARTTIVDNPALGAHDMGWLRALVSSCELIESDRSRVEAICDTLPRTIVAGDLVDRNLRLKGDGTVAFDRELSGWGVPAPDVYEFAANATRYDLSSSRSIIAEYMPGVGDDELQALLLVGKGFRLLASADWASRDLTHAWPEKGMASLPMYQQPLHAWGMTLAAAAQPA